MADYWPTLTNWPHSLLLQSTEFSPGSVLSVAPKVCSPQAGSSQPTVASAGKNSPGAGTGPDSGTLLSARIAGLI